MDELKNLLGDELFNQVLPKLEENTLTIVPKGKKVFLHDEKDEVVISNNGEWLPKAKFDKVNQEKKGYEEQIATLGEDLEKLKKSGGKNEELANEIEALQNKNTEIENARALDKKRFAVREVLRDNNAKYVELLEGKIDLSKIEIDDAGKIKSADSVINPLKEAYKEMFVEKKLFDPNIHNPNHNPNVNEKYYTMEQINNMPMNEKVDNIDKVNASISYWESNGNK